MIVKIQKRDDSIVDYDLSKISLAIGKAGNSTKEFDKKITNSLTRKVDVIISQLNKEIINVEEIQDIVEATLLTSKYKQSAKSYILYRDQHAKLRDVTTVANIDLIDHYLDKTDWQVKENSNMAYSLQGLNNYISSEVTKTYWLNKVYPKNIRDLHTNGDIHIHDLNTFAVYCVGWDLHDLLIRGYGGVPGKLNSSPAKHLRTALGQAVNFLYTLQGECAGAQAFSNFDTLLAPFIRYDNLTYDEVKQAMQEFVFNLNVPTRTGFQSPFSNITMDLKVPPQFKDLPVIIGGELQKETYSDFQKEMDLFNSVFTEVMTEGDSMGRVFTFPIPTYNITKDFDWDNKNLDGLWEMTAKYGIPYFSNFINSDMKPEDARSMAILGNQELIYKKENGCVSRCPAKNIVSSWVNHKEPPNIKILMNGEFIDIIDMFKVPYENYRTYVSIELDNGYLQDFSYQHKCAVIRDDMLVEVESQDVKTTDKFLISKKGYEGNPLLGDYQSGKILGYYLGEGWKESKSDGCISFAININRTDIVDEINDFFTKMVCNVKIVPWEDKHIYKVTVSGKQALGFVDNFIRGRKATEKMLQSTIWNTSLEFRTGLLEGLYQTGGHAQQKILTHTTNKDIIIDLIHLANSVGKILRYKINNKNSRYFKKDKSDLVYFKSYKLYFIEYKETFELDGEEYSLIPVKSVIEHDSKASKVYNFTVNTNRHLYELPNGIITHQCCRLRLNVKTLEKRGGGLFGSNPLTGSIGVVTINLPRLGFVSTTKEEFIEKLLGLVEAASESLEIKRKVLENYTDKNLYPYIKHYLDAIYERSKQYWINHFSTIGIVGMNEACLNFLGEDITSENGMAFSLEICDIIRNKLVEIQETTGNNYNFEATPAEGTSYRLSLMDKKKYPDIICADEEAYANGAEPFYTNSTQLPVNFTDDIFEIFDRQDELQQKYTGGTVIHVYVGEKIHDYTILKNLVKKLCEQYHTPYFTITPTFSICPTHGYIAGEHAECPTCEAPTEIYSRVTGYIRPINQWNAGKRSEFEKRKTVKI